MTATPKQVVVVSMIGTAAVVIVSNARKGNLPSSRAVLGLGFVYVVLAMLADVAPRLATPFAALVFVGTLLEIGGGVLSSLAGTVSGSGPLTKPDVPLNVGVPVGGDQAPVGGKSSGHGPGIGLVTIPSRYWAPGASQIRLRGDVAPMALAVCERFGLVITSGFRSVAHNASLADSAPNSLHLCGAAADFVDRDGGLQHAEAAYAWALKQHFTEVEPWSASRDHLHIGFASCG